MQYSPKLKIAMEEIKAILDKHQLGAWVILHTPGYSEFLNRLDPPYSCITVDGNHVRFKSKLADYNGDKKAWHRKTEDSLNLLQTICTVGGGTLLPIMDLTEKLEVELQAECGKSGGFTDHTTQNN